MGADVEANRVRAYEAGIKAAQAGAVAVAAGAVGSRLISVFHRFFGRAQWSLDAVGRVLFSLALVWVPADQRLLVLVDDTLARKSGKGVSLATMHHDPLLASARKPFRSFGHVWVGMGHASTNPLGVEWFGLVMGLGFVLSFGYWTTNFTEVQRALSAKDLSAAQRTPLIAAYPKIFIPALTIIPGLVALVTVKGLGGSSPSLRTSSATRATTEAGYRAAPATDPAAAE